MRLPICSDWPSTPIRRSRLLGLLSITMVTVWEEGRFLLHPVNASMMLKARKNRKRSDIGDLAQDCGPRRTGCGRDISRAVVPRLVGQQGEGGRFFRFRRQPEFVAGLHSASQGLELVMQHLHQGQIARTASGDE